MTHVTYFTRAGILQQMVPIFVTPFEKIEGDGLEDKLPELRKILATDYPSSVYFLLLRWKRRQLFGDYARGGGCPVTIVNYQWIVDCVPGGAGGL